MDGQHTGCIDRHVMHAHGSSTPASFALHTAMWFGMMTAMMAPTVWPWIVSFHRFVGAEHGTHRGATIRFAAGYVVAWAAYSIGAAGIELTLLRAGALNGITASATPPIAAAVLVLAGLYQFAPIKRACLTHCRSPLGYFLTRWQDGPMGGFRLGVNHGFFCVGCCWALMATAFAVGIMNVAWMAALAAVVSIEQVAPHGHRVRVALGVGFLIAGAWRYFVAAA